MLQSCSGRDTGHSTFHTCISSSSSSSSSSKLQSLQCPFRNRVLLAFRLRNLNPPRVFLGFKVRCRAGAVALPPTKRNSPIIVLNCLYRVNKVEELLTPIFKDLEDDPETDEIINSLREQNLNSKERSEVLLSQNKWKRIVRVFEFFCSQEGYAPDVYHYTIVLRALGAARKWDELRICWLRMAKDGVLPDNHTYSSLVDVFGKAGFVQESLLWIKHMRLMGLFPNAITMSTVVNVLKDEGELDRADRFYKNWCVGRVDLDDLELDSVEDFRDGTGSVPRHFLLGELFKVGGRPPNSEMVGSCDVNDYVKRPFPTTTYNTLIDMYGKAGRLKDAGDVFAEMLEDGAKMNTITFNTMINICGSCGNLREAEFLLGEMEKEGLCPDTWTYTTIFRMYVRAGDIDAVLRCYKKIKEVGLFPILVNPITLHILCERNMVREVEDIIDERSLPWLINMYVDEGMLNKINNLLERFQYCGSFSSTTRATIMNTLEKNGLWAEVERVFSSRSNSIEKKDVVEYNAMLKAYGLAKLHDKASLLFKEMKNQGIRLNSRTYRSLIQMFAGADMVDQAMQLLAEMQRLGFKPVCRTFSAIIACYVRLNQLSDAVDVYRQMKRAGVEPNEFVYGTLMNGFLEQGEFEKVIHYFHKMEESGISANRVVLSFLAKAYAMSGSLEEVIAIFERMKRMEGGLDVVTSATMIDNFAQFGLVSGAQFVYDNLMENGLGDSYPFARILHFYKSMRMENECNKVIEDFKKSGAPWNVKSLTLAMDSYATTGQFRKCVELFHEMVPQKFLPDDVTINVLLNVTRKLKLPTEAMIQVQSAYLEKKPYAMEAIIAAVSSGVGLHGVAVQWCETFIKADVALGSFAYNVAIKTYERSGKVDEALSVYLKMQDHGLKPDAVTYANLATCYGKAGMVEGLKRIYSLLKRREIEPTILLCKTLSYALKVAKMRGPAYTVKQMQFALKEKSRDEGRTIMIVHEDESGSEIES